MSPAPMKIKTKVFLGIDPGKSGGLAVLRQRTNSLGYPFILTYKMPETEFDLWNLLHPINEEYSVSCCLERVHSMPNEGHKGTFTFGEGFGRLKMALVAAGIPYELVEPQRWQKEFSIASRKAKEPKKLLKERCRAMAQQLFPDLSIWTGTLGVQRAVCDAVLLAEYARRRSNTLRKE